MSVIEMQLDRDDHSGRVSSADPSCTKTAPKGPASRYSSYCRCAVSSTAAKRKRERESRLKDYAKTVVLWRWHCRHCLNLCSAAITADGQNADEMRSF